VVESRRLWIQSQPGIHSKTVSKQTKKIMKKAKNMKNKLIFVSLYWKTPVFSRIRKKLKITASLNFSFCSSLFSIWSFLSLLYDGFLAPLLWPSDWGTCAFAGPCRGICQGAFKTTDKHSTFLGVNCTPRWSNGSHGKLPLFQETSSPALASGDVC
jgi:hypothetical protein